MGLLNHLFGSKKSAAKKLVLDNEQRMALWEKHLSNYLEREELSKHFSPKNIDMTLQDFKTVERILRKIEALISPELINIANAKKTDEDILADLEKLKSSPEIEELSLEIRSLGGEHSTLLTIFREIRNFLEAELHLIRLIRKKPKNVRDLLLKLFKIIFHQEARLYEVFREERFFEENKHIHAKIIRITRAIILEEKVEKVKDEEKLAREIVKQMAPEEENEYRDLSEDIFYKLAEKAGAPLVKPDDLIQGIKDMEDFIKSDKILYKIVKDLKPRYNDKKIKAIILAFREAYRFNYFEDLEGDLHKYIPP